MKKSAIENIKATFEANPGLEEVFANEFGHCFKNNGEGLSPVKRSELDSLKAEDEEATGESEGGAEGGSEGGKKGKKK